MKLSFKEKAAYGLGAVGKDMVYMLSASYILYYYQDLLGIAGTVMGAIMMAARVFDAFNDPIMGVVVAKTRTKWGRFRPWLLIGTVSNALILYLVFSAPPSLSGNGLIAYAAVFYILWGVTYTMMDIPFWSMIPAFTEGGKEREGLTAMARSCAGVGSALITVVTMLMVPMLGGITHGAEAERAAQISEQIAATEDSAALATLNDELKLVNNPIERSGFSTFALIVAVVFVVFIVITCLVIKEHSSVDMKAPSIGEMFKALITNDQAMTVVITIVLVNASLYITSNLLIYFFKYDIGGSGWNGSYVLFNTFGGGMQILSMMIIYPLVRKFMSVQKVCYLSFACAIGGYAVLLVLMMSGVKSLAFLLIPGFFVFVAFGLLTVLTTVFLANTVDYGELKNHRRDESVIFSMQTFVVKLASGVAVFITGIALDAFHISQDSEAAVTAAEEAAANLTGLRLTMTVLPIAGMLVALFVFFKKFLLTEEKMNEINKELEARRG
ncbi:MAG: glycoside-pentoside-hexuronide (GPH):cation symporter [Lachnospiraceae bacterium]|nr:glycoside-pentoside-hexuronide (GPH):cation symporter [Lachnospiraceae bacterium]